MELATLVIVCYVMNTQPENEYCSPPMSEVSALIRFATLNADETVADVTLYQEGEEGYGERLTRRSCVTAKEAAFAHKIAAASRDAQNDDVILSDPFRGHEPILRKLPGSIRSGAFDAFDVCIPRGELTGPETVDRMMEFIRGDDDRRKLLILVHGEGFHFQPVVYVLRRRYGCPLPPITCAAE